MVNGCNFACDVDDDLHDEGKVILTVPLTVEMVCTDESDYLTCSSWKHRKDGLFVKESGDISWLPMYLARNVNFCEKESWCGVSFPMPPIRLFCYLIKALIWFKSAKMEAMDGVSLG